MVDLVQYDPAPAPTKAEFDALHGNATELTINVDYSFTTPDYIGEFVQIQVHEWRGLYIVTTIGTFGQEQADHLINILEKVQIKNHATFRGIGNVEIYLQGSGDEVPAVFRIRNKNTLAIQIIPEATISVGGIFRMFAWLIPID